MARHDAFNVFIDLYESIVSSLQEIRNRNDGWNAQSANDAMSLYMIAKTQFPFIAALITTRDIMAYVQPISVSLQSKTIDIVKATDQIKNVIGALEDIREKMDTFSQQVVLKHYQRGGNGRGSTGAATHVWTAAKSGQCPDRRLQGVLQKEYHNTNA